MCWFSCAMIEMGGIVKPTSCSNRPSVCMLSTVTLTLAIYKYEA